MQDCCNPCDQFQVNTFPLLQYRIDNNLCGLLHSSYISATAMQDELQVLCLTALPLNFCYGNIVEIPGMPFPMHGAHISCDSTEDMYPSAYYLDNLYSTMHYKISLALTARGCIQMQLAVHFRDAGVSTQARAVPAAYGQWFVFLNTPPQT